QHSQNVPLNPTLTRLVLKRPDRRTLIRSKRSPSKTICTTGTETSATGLPVSRHKGGQRFLEAHAQTQLESARRGTGTARAEHAISTDAVRIARVIEHVKEIRVDSYVDALGNSEDLEQGRILPPLQNARPPLVHERIEHAGEVIGADGGAILEWNPDRVGVPVSRDIRASGGVGRHSGAAPWDQGSYRRLVVRRDAHVPVGPAARIDAVDLVCRNIPVPPQIPGDTDAAVAVLDRVLVAVKAHRLAGEVPVPGRQREPGAAQGAAAGNLPATQPR